jgi:Cu(I)/Ag(I) efflux system membrane fusion protein
MNDADRSREEAGMARMLERASRMGFSRKIVATACIVAAVLTALALSGCGSTGGSADEGEAVQGLAAGENDGTVIWTCAMHPQIRQSKPGKCPICAMDLVPVTEAASGGAVVPELRLSPAAIKLAEIETAPVERRAVAMQVRMAGKVEYDETRVSYVTAWVPGRLDRLHVNYTGTEVKAGAPMVSIYSPDLIAAQEELIQAVRATENVHPGGAESLRQTTEETLQAVREKLRLLGLTPQQISEIEARGTVSDDIVIRAPIGGVVVEKNALEGQYVTTGTRIYTIADLTNVWVKLDAYESDLSWLRPGQHVEFSTDAYPGETFRGEVAFIDPILDPGTRTAKVRVNVGNPAGKLKPEMFVHGTVLSDVGLAGRGGLPLVIPASAPLITGRRAVVYVETEPGLYTGVEITLGARAGDFYVVEAGLEEGQRVVTNGNFKIDSAIQILARPSMMNPESGYRAGRELSHAGQRFEVPAEFAREARGVLDAYLEIHHGLSRDSLDEANGGAKQLEDRLASVNMELLGQAAHDAWMKYVGDLRTDAGTVLSAPDISAARAAFASLSETMYGMMERFGITGDSPIYHVYCSMAFSDSGAFWLQSNDEVENPYWGAAMFRCGEMQDTIPTAPESMPGETQHE